MCENREDDGDSENNLKKSLILTYGFYDGKEVPIFKIPQEIIEILLYSYLFITFLVEITFLVAKLLY